MKIHVRLFAAMKDIIGRREIVLEVPEGTTASALLRRFVVEYPRLQALQPSLLVAVNREYVEATRALKDGDEVAYIPPVSGGADLYEVTENPLSLDGLVMVVRQNASGAVATFLGVVREIARGRRVSFLEYDAYPEMAIATMRRIGEEIRLRWPVDRIALVHRIGRLEIGEASIAIAISSAHRREALEACAFAIERVKEIVPIWKKEVWTDGAEWIGSTVDEYKERKDPAKERVRPS
ncbi:MAG TPA: MoaD family protein [Candidatus Methylomirabilis sp.]|nr:MoaD family protein [Candidatus Methylomirabilis sp.]